MFRRIRNLIKCQSGRQFAWKSSRLKKRDCFTAVPNWYLKPFLSNGGLKFRKSSTHTHTHTHTNIHTSGSQLRTTFLDILDHSGYSDTNISHFFHKNIASSVRKQKKTNILKMSRKFIWSNNNYEKLLKNWWNKIIAKWIIR